MIQLGKEQTLEVLRNTSIGAYLGEARDPLSIFARKSEGNSASITDKTDVLLPKNEIKKPLNPGETVRAFIYLDSEDRPVATLKTPSLTVGKLCTLKVKEINKVGAFLNWGLPKDLFLPFKEQTAPVAEGDDVLVTLYVDKSKRLCATMKLYKHLRTDSEYRKNDRVKGKVYEIIDSFGAFVAVDNCFSGLIPKKELVKQVKVGDVLELRVAKVQEDGKLELSMREPSHVQLGSDCEKVLGLLRESKNGFLPYHDKSDSDVIRGAFGMSKNEFKRAIGHLMKQGLINIHEDGISLKGSR